MRFENTSCGCGFSLKRVIWPSSSKPTMPKRVGSSTSHRPKVPIPALASCLAIICSKGNEDTMSPLKQANRPLMKSWQFLSAPPVPSIFSSRTIVTSKPGSFCAKYSAIISTLYPAATTTSSTIDGGIISTTRSKRVMSSIGNSGFGVELVHGCILEPIPPARMTTCMVMAR